MAHLASMVTRERRRQLDLGEGPTPSTPMPDMEVSTTEENELVDALKKMPIGAVVGTYVVQTMGNTAKFSGREANPSIAWKKLPPNTQRILPQYHSCVRSLFSVDHAEEEMENNNMTRRPIRSSLTSSGRSWTSLPSLSSRAPSWRKAMMDTARSS